MSIKGVMTMEQERVSFNLARLKKGGQNFEVAVDADLAIGFKSGKAVNVRDIIKSEKIFADVKKGTLAPEHIIKQVFSTSDPLQVATAILTEGEIQLTQEHREKLREEKRRKIIDIIRRNSIDPKTKLPHPPQRIENAMEEARVNINEFKSAEDQIDDIIKKIRIVLPISFEAKRISVRIPSEYAGKAYTTIAHFAKPQNEEWRNDGSYVCIVEMPAGLEPDFYDKLNAMTHGSAETKVIGK